MLIPVFLFGFLSMSISVFSGLLCNVFVAILPNYSCTVPTDPSNPPDFHQFWKTNQPAFSWVMPTDPNFINDIKKTMATDPTREKLVPPVQIVINPFDRGGFNANAFNTPGINFGLNNGQVNQRLLFSLISLWLYAAVMKKMVEKMPEVAQEIAGAISGVRFNNPIGGGIKALQNKVNSALSDAKQGALTVGGAALSGGITGAATKNGVATEAATITGGIIGNVLSRKI